MSKQATTRRADSAAPPADQASETPSLAKRGKAIDEAIDKLLDEIDDVLEENAEEFVKGYVQRGGQ